MFLLLELNKKIAKDNYLQNFISYNTFHYQLELNAI